MASSIRPGQVNGIHLSCRPSRDTTQSCKLPAETDSSTVTTTCGYHYIEDLSRNYFPHTTAAQIPVSLFPTLNIYREPYLSDRSNIHVDQQVRYVRRRPILLPSGEHTSAMERLQALRVQQEVFRYQYERETNVPLVSMTTTRSEGFVPPGHSLAGTSVTGFDHSVVSKRPRLAVEMKPTLHHPLVIDTSNASEDLMYNPQVEAISPTPPEDTRFLVSPQRSSKDDVLQSINRINREIVQLDQQVTNLQKKQHQLEREASQPSDSSDISQETSVSELKQLSRAQLIYSDNKNKARKAQNFMEHLGPKIDLPLYNQPSDTAVYHENKRKFMTLKKKLIVILLKKQQERQLRETFLMENYTKLMQEWLKKIDKRNSNGNRRAKETKQREFFEKQFPELKKQREDKERFSRVGQRVKSEAEMEEILDGIHEQELEDKKMKSYTVIPPILLDLRRRRIKFINNNGFVEDLVAEYQQRHFLNMWTNQEKDVFREKYLQHLKNFVFIASHLERKDVADCVQYYYLTKKSENYKQLIRKQSARKRTRTLVKPSSYGHSATQSSITPTTALTTTAGRNVGVTTTTLTPLFSTASSSTLDSEAKHEEDVAGLVNVHDCQSSSLMAVVSRMDCSSKVQIEVGDNEVIQKTDNSLEEEYKDFQSETSRCAVCHIFLDNLSQSHHATKSNCNSFGLKGTDLHVCSSCNIKSTRRSCPIPTCKTSKQKLKRLRSFPSKWDEVSEQLRDSVVAEFQIPQGVQACCCGCFNRISRKLGIPSKSKDTELEKWSNEEIELFKCGLRQFGKNWESILKMVTSKTKEDCQYLYLHFKEKLNVEASNKGDKQLDEDRIIERKLQDFGTKDEDSGEITSSCEEDNCIDRCSSDTASALSPAIGGEGMKSKEVPETIDQNMNLRKSTDSLKNSLDYDSSATMSADEDQGQNGSQLRRKELNSIIQNILVSDDTIEPKDHVPVTKALSPIPVPCSQYNVPVGKGPCKGEPTCVRDLIYQAIEYSLQAPNKSSHTSTPVPVTSHSKGSYNSVEVRQEEIEACLSRPPQVVHGSSVLPVSIPDAEGLAMMAQFSQILLREQNEVQDLSKKDKDLRIPTQRISSQLPSGSGVLHQQIPYSQYGAPPPAHSNQYSRSSQPPPDILPLSSLDVSRDTHFSCLGRAGFAQSDSLHLQPPHLVAQASSPGPQTRRLTVPPPPSPSINISPGQQTLGLTVPLPPLITNSKPSNSKFPHLSSGSITQGTPLNLYPNPNIPLNPSNHEGLLRPIHPTQLKDVGSITHGTPLHDQKRPMKSNFCTVSACLPISGTEGGSNRRISPFSTEVLSKTAVPMTYEQVVDRECHRLTSSPYASSQSAYKISSNTIRAGFVSDTSSSKQLMIDFNTSKQMNRGSFTSDKESSKVQSSRDSSPHLLQQDSGLSQVCANVSFSAPEIHGTPLSTSMTDQSLSHSPENQWAFHRRQPDLQSFNAALSQPLSRQNIIRSITWGTGKPSVIQVPKSSSSCSPQSFSPATEKKPPSPHPASHPVLALSHDDFNTLVDTAIAQPSLTILKEDKRPELNRSPLNQTFMQSEQRSLTNMQQHPRSLCESSSSDSPRLQEYYKIEPIQRYFSSKVEGEDERESLPQIADRTSCLPAHYRCGVDNIVAGEQRLNHQLSSSIHSMQEPFTQEKFEQELINAKNGKDQKTAQNWNEEMKETSPVDAKRKLENPLHLGHFHHQSELGREAARILSESFQKEKPKVRPTNNQFTAVHLIDAIITRQISQNPDTEPRNHNLDNSFVHQLNESLTRQRAIKGSLGNDEVTTTEETSAADRFGKTDTCRTHDHIQDDPVILDPVHVFTLKQQIEDIISKNYNCSSNCSVSTSAYSSTNTGSVQSTVPLDIPRKGTSEFLTYSGVSRNLPSVDSHCSTVNGRRPIEGVTSVTVTSCSSLGESDHLAKDCPGSRCVYHSWKLRKALQSERNYTSLDTQSLGTSSIPNHNERHTTYVTHEARPSSRPPGHHHTLPLTSYAVEPISPPLQKNEANNELSNENVLGNTLPTLSQNFTWSPSASIAGMFASKQHHPQSPCSTSNHHQMNLSPLDYVKNKIVEVMKTESIEIQSQTLGNQAVRNENLKFPSLQHTMNESTNLLERPQSNGNSISPQQPQSSQIKPIYNTRGVTISQASSDVGFIQPVESSKGLKRSFDTAGLEEPRLTSKSVSSSSSDLGVELGKRSRIDYTSLPKSSTEQVLQELPESSESTLQEFLQLSSSGRCCDNNNLVTKGYNSPYTVTGSGISDSSPQAIQQEDRVSGVESSTDDNGNERRQCEVTSGNSEDRLLPDASSQLVDSPGSSGEMIVDESSNVNNTSSSRIEPISPLQERVSTSGQIEGFEEATSSTSSDVAQNNTVTSSFCQSSSAQVCHSPYGPSASVSSSTVPCSSPGPSSSVMPSGSPSYSSFTGVTTTYAYPFSALTVRSVGHPENSATSPQSSVPAMALVYSTNQFTSHGPSLGSSNNCPSSASRDPQPVSLLSSQYEPLSDED